MKNADSIQDYYNKFYSNSKKFKALKSKFALYYQEARLYAFSLFHDLKDKKILEIGIGSGYETKIFLKQRAKVTAIDISSRALEMANKRYKKAYKNSFRTVKGDIHKLNFNANSFDYIYGNSILMFVDHKKVLKECTRVLKPKGKIIIVDSLNKNLIAKIYRKLRAPWRRSIRPGYYDLKENSAFSRSYKIKYRVFYFLSIFLLSLDHRKLLFRIVYAIDNYISKRFKLLHQYFWIVVLEITK